MVATLLKKFLSEKNKTFLKNRFKLLYKLHLKRLYFGKYPKSLIIEPTNRCNLKCSYCTRSKGLRTVGDDLPLEKFKSIVRELQKLSKLESVTPTGFGEPLLWRELEDAIKFVKTDYPHTKVDITTNGTLLTEEKAISLLNAGLDNITISINAANRERYIELNRADKFEVVKNNTEFFLNLLRKTPRYKIAVVVQLLGATHTEEEVNNFKKFWISLLPKNGRLQIHRLFNWGGSIESDRQTIEDKLHSCHIKERRPCPLIQGGCVIAQNGNMVACCTALGYDNPGALILGNVFLQSIKEILNGQARNQLKLINQRGEIHKISLCANCDAWKSAPDIWFKNPFFPWLGKRWI